MSKFIVIQNAIPVYRQQDKVDSLPHLHNLKEHLDELLTRGWINESEYDRLSKKIDDYTHRISFSTSD